MKLTSRVIERARDWLSKPTNLGHILVLYWLFVFNAPLWHHLYSLHLNGGLTWSTILFFAFILWGVLRLLLSFGCWPRLFTGWAVVLTAIAAAAAYFMSNYHIVIDQNMIRNVFETDHREALELLNWNLVWWFGLTVLIPAWIIVRIELNWGLRPWFASLAGMFWGVGVIILAIILHFDGLSSLFRNHREIRFMVTPTNAVYYTFRYWQERWREPPVFKHIAKQVKLEKKWSDAKPPIVVFIAGETARRDHFQLNGYSRPTNPTLMQRRDSLINFLDVWSCGTDTAHSLPCMFGFMTQDIFDVEKARYQENVLDVAKRAGYRVLWRDNSTGCKHICDRVELQTYKDFGRQDECHATGCHDEILLNGLREWINQANAPAFIVLHTIGSHGPAYYRRYPPRFAKFQPECRTNHLDKCAREALVNAYDNTILYTDFFINQVITWLEVNYPDRPTAMIYVSDHGESLGENGIFLHGLPYFMAPDEQKRVPMMLWFSDGFQRTFKFSRQCLLQAAKQKLNHDIISHSLLSILSIRTDIHDAALDVTQNCQAMRL